ncbi:GNAT family N-acetyltransferase [Haloarcula nitratireducens]|uniref:GNAT family N-acetyltransferase n=1 Tax=Haloarcula nitratireducens TaxID=2487749 RepID=A0AAW4P9F5_9EURY|nr:GNAT family N-acetyltransferase [Halomicroarcula nitratireducens]MBX0294295.1 GNAT family N-acetyltransferase [Halomicroarcula nitratireducens]
MTTYDCYVGSEAALGDRARSVRRTVFIEEQGVSEAEEMDDKDDVATHVLLTEGDEPVATARLRLVGEATAKVERVAVLADYRGEGLGVRVMDAVETVAVDRGATDAKLHGQTQVRGFYERLGYEAVGEEFEEAGIPHVEMVKPLD